MDQETLRLAAVADIHYTKHSHGHLQQMFERASTEADVLLLCGDLTDYGLAEEARVLAEDIRKYVRIPCLAVLGNHDYESDQAGAVCSALDEAGVQLLDGECVEIQGVGFAGICGFGGGFGRWMLNAWGEKVIKDFVQEAIDQARRLEQALARLHTERRVVLLHYSPIRETVEGEPPEIFPFLGSTRLESPLNRFKVDMAFHGHAHNGHHEGHTSEGVPVYNVAMQILARMPEVAPHGFRVFEISKGAPVLAGAVS